jgi:cytochrome c oxidase cbb3-type subunit 3
MRRAAPLLLLVLAAGCGRGPSRGKVTAEQAEGLAAHVWQTRCATCHGASGRGDGPLAPSLSVPPRDFADPDFLARADERHVATTIVRGGAAVGLSVLMPANPDLARRPEVLQRLVERVRAGAGPPPVTEAPDEAPSEARRQPPGGSPAKGA